MNKIIIRQEEERDYKAVYQVVKEAFEKEEYSDKDEHNLVERLRKSKAFIEELSLVAEIEGKIVGHIMFTTIKIGNNTALALAPVSVSPDHQGLGIGSKLIIRGHEIAKKLGHKAVVLLGHESYYPRFGYKKASDYNIKAPFEVPDENFMVVELIEGELKKLEGVVEYAKEFFEV